MYRSTNTCQKTKKQTKSNRKTPKKSIIVGEIYADWCGHCKVLKPEWEKMKTMIKQNTGRTLKNVGFHIEEIKDSETIDIKELINTFNENPVGTAYNIRMTYTDSASIKAKLSAPVHLDYSHLSFKYSEFPEGLKVIFYNEEKQENTVFADYGILYNQTKIVDLKGNVVLLSHDGSRLETSQMYWDAEKEWLFTEEPFIFQNSDYNLAANRLVTNKEFTKFLTGKLSGTIEVKEKKDSIIIDEKL